MLSDAASWTTIIGGAFTILVTVTGCVFWMSAMYFNGRATAKSLAKVETGLANIWKFVRRKHRKSDLFRMRADSKFKDHHERLLRLEQGGEEES